MVCVLIWGVPGPNDDLSFNEDIGVTSVNQGEEQVAVPGEEGNKHRSILVCWLVIASAVFTATGYPRRCK